MKRNAITCWVVPGTCMVLIKPDDQVLDYRIYLLRIALATQDLVKFLGFYEKWSGA